MSQLAKTASRVLTMQNSLWNDHFNSIRAANTLNVDWIRVSKGNPCPVCAKDDWCLHHHTGSKTICSRITSDITVKTGWLHVHEDDGEGWFERQRRISEAAIARQQWKARESATRASEDQLDKFHSWMLTKFKLSEKDAKHLRSEGLIDLSDFGTLPSSDKYHCLEIPHAFANGIPGIFTSWNDEKQYINTWANGWFHIVRNESGKAVGCEVKLSEQCLKKNRSSAKYQPLTSMNKNNGISADAKQYGIIRAKDRKYSNILMVTEGRKKAQIASETFSYDVAYVRGIGNWSRLIEDFKDKFPEVDTIIIAVDMDYKKNPQVAGQRRQLIDAFIQKIYLNVQSMEWDLEEAKGIDDAILNGVSKTTLDLYKGKMIYSVSEVGNAVYNKMSYNMNNPNGKVNLYHVTGGAGKTRSAIDVVNDHLRNGTWFQTRNGKNARVLWLTENNYDLLDEVEKEFVVKPARLEGRNEDENHPFGCADHETTLRIAENHQSVMKQLCVSCPMRDYCQYLKSSTKVMEKSDFVISVKSVFFNESERLDAFDIIIIDESMAEDIYKTKQITPKDIQDHKNTLAHLMQSGTLSADQQDRADLTEMILDLVDGEIESWNDKNEARKKLNPAHHHDLDPVSITEHLKDLRSAYIDYETRVISSSNGEDYFLKAFVADLVKNPAYVYQGRLFIDVIQRRLLEHFNNKTIINLDASPSYTKIGLINSNVKIHEYCVQEYVNVYQVTGLKGSKGQLMSEKYQQRFLDAIEYIATKDPNAKTTVLSLKSFIDVLEEYQQEAGFETMNGWYGNHTRGFNKFQDTDNLILAGRFTRNLAHMRMQMETLNYMGADCTLDDLIIEDTLNEMMQAAWRGRAVRRKENPLNLFMLTNQRIPQYYNIKEVGSLEQFIGKTIRNQQEGNLVRQEEAVNKARVAIQGVYDSGKSVLSINIHQTAKENGSKYDLVKQQVKEFYLQELIEGCEDYEKYSVALEQIASELRKPTPLEIDWMNLKLTRFSASVLYTYCPDAAKHVISTEKPVADYFLEHPPAGVNVNKWADLIQQIQLSPADAAVKEIAEGAEISRQTAAKYIQKMADMLNEVDVTVIIAPKDPETWNTDELEGESLIREWANNTANDIQEIEIIDDELDAITEKMDYIDTNEDSMYDIAQALRFMTMNLTPVLTKEQRKEEYIALLDIYKAWHRFKG